MCYAIRSFARVRAIGNRPLKSLHARLCEIVRQKNRSCSFGLLVVRRNSLALSELYKRGWWMGWDFENDRGNKKGNTTFDEKSIFKSVREENAEEWKTGIGHCHVPLYVAIGGREHLRETIAV